MDVYYQNLCQSDNELDRSHGNAYNASGQVGDTSPTGVACEITGDTWPHVESWIRSSIGRSVARYRARTGIDVELQSVDIDDIVQDATVLLLEVVADLDELDLDDWRDFASREAARATWKHLRDNADKNARLSADEWNSLSEENIRFSPRTTDLSGLQSAIECLPSETSRQVAIYLACSDFSQEQIGKELGITQQAIALQIVKLRRRLGSSLVWRSIRSGAVSVLHTRVGCVLSEPRPRNPVEPDSQYLFVRVVRRPTVPRYRPLVAPLDYHASRELCDQLEREQLSRNRAARRKIGILT